MNENKKKLLTRAVQGTNNVNILKQTDISLIKKVWYKRLSSISRPATRTAHNSCDK